VDARHNDKFEITAVYTTGKIEQRIEDIARSTGLPADELTRRVAELLLGSQGGEVLRPDHSLPALRTNGTRPRRAAPEMAMAGRPRKYAAQMNGAVSKRDQEIVRLYQQGMPIPELSERMGVSGSTVYKTLKISGIKEGRRSLLGYKYNGTHWTQKPENKARMRAQMKKMAKAR
jgi:DNA-binding CsgD family transcriptional regulator